VPGIEVLEGRVVPAGTVTTSFAAGLLTITADDDLLTLANNNQNINVNGSAPGAFTLVGNNFETFAGAGVGPFAGVTSIKLDMKLGKHGRQRQLLHRHRQRLPCAWGRRRQRDLRCHHDQ
jgi:hypothetical protein